MKPEESKRVVSRSWRYLVIASRSCASSEAVLCKLAVILLLCIFMRSRSVSGRTAIHPDGNDGYGWVHTGTILLWRIVYLAILLSCKRARFIIEQPASSAVDFHPALDFLRERVFVTYLV